MNSPSANICKRDRLVIYDDTLFVDRVIPDYLDYLQNGSSVCPEDPLEDKRFFAGKAPGQSRIRISTDNTVTKLLFQVLPIEGTIFLSVFRCLSGT